MHDDDSSYTILRKYYSKSDLPADIVGKVKEVKELNVFKEEGEIGKGCLEIIVVLFGEEVVLHLTRDMRDVTLTLEEVALLREKIEKIEERLLREKIEKVEKMLLRKRLERELGRVDPLS